MATAGTGTAGTVIEFKPQPGPQTQFLATDADIAIFGGGRGGGKSFGLLLEGLRNSRNPAVSTVIFRREYPQIHQDGGLWDTSEQIYPYAGGVPHYGDSSWTFTSGHRVAFRHMANESDRYTWLGAQVPVIGFDELATFTEKQFFFMLGSNRDPSGTIKPYIRATTNPEPGWLARFLSWWWDPNTGYAIEERSGKLRWFVRVADTIEWGNSAEELKARYPGLVPKSVTFIRSLVHDNPALLEKDPGYLASLMAQSLVDRERYLFGNWKIKASAGMMFRRQDFKLIQQAPMHQIRRFVRFWDLAATEEGDGNDDPDWTAGVLLGELAGEWYVLDVRRFRLPPKGVEDEIRRTAQHDPPNTAARMETEPGASGKSVVDYYSRGVFLGFDFMGVPPIRRRVHGEYQWANALSSAVANGKVYVLDRPWTNNFIDELESIPEGAHDDQAIACASAMAVMSGSESGAFRRVEQPSDALRMPRDARARRTLL